MDNYRISEIFSSIEGEGRRAGLPATFVRFFGCNLNCKWCDSRYAWETVNSSVMNMSYGQIVGKILDCGNRLITFTGGEPLMHIPLKFINKFLADFPDRFHVNIETNGSIRIPEKLLRNKNCMLTVDYKLQSSGVSPIDMVVDFRNLRKTDAVKFVIGSESDFEQMIEFLEGVTIEACIFVSPVFGAVKLDWLAEQIKKYREFGLRMQIQMHKVIWNPNERGV